jgi:hypothetical protein
MGVKLQIDRLHVPMSGTLPPSSDYKHISSFYVEHQAD